MCQIYLKCVKVEVPLGLSINALSVPEYSRGTVEDVFALSAYAVTWCTLSVFILRSSDFRDF